MHFDFGPLVSILIPDVAVIAVLMVIRWVIRFMSRDD